MTTKADERITRIEDAIARLEALGLTGPSPSPAAVNPDGSPGLVAPGELIESSWGNAVANEFQRKRAWFVQNQTNASFPATTPANFPGLSVSVTFLAGRVYRATAFVPFCQRTLTGVSKIYLIGSNGTVVLNTGFDMNVDGFSFSMFTSWVFKPVTTITDTINVRMSTSAGVLTVTGNTENQNILCLEEISMV